LCTGTLRCTCAVPPNTTADGVVVEGYEYQRYDPNASPYWDPLRLPGQYHDEETDLNQNWNRFYEPGTGRYLEPEPILLFSNHQAMLAERSTPLPVYSYAGNNPIRDIDSDGLLFWSPPGDTQAQSGINSALNSDDPAVRSAAETIANDPGGYMIVQSTDSMDPTTPLGTHGGGVNLEADGDWQIIVSPNLANMESGLSSDEVFQHEILGSYYRIYDGSDPDWAHVRATKSVGPCY